MSATYKADPRSWVGVEVSRQTADNYLEESVRFLQKNPDKHYVYHATGNRAVFVFRTNEFEGTENFEVYDCVVKRNDVLTINDSGYIVNKFKRDY